MNYNDHAKSVKTDLDNINVGLAWCETFCLNNCKKTLVYLIVKLYNVGLLELKYNTW